MFKLTNDVSYGANGPGLRDLIYDANQCLLQYVTYERSHASEDWQSKRSFLVLNVERQS
jgi:hypothetical protein